MSSLTDDLLNTVSRCLGGLREFSLYGCRRLTDHGVIAVSGSDCPHLRGRKATLWEGGVRGAACVSGFGLAPGLRGTISREMMHVVDWMPTLLSLAIRGAGPVIGEGSWGALLPAAEPPFCLA